MGKDERIQSSAVVFTLNNWELYDVEPDDYIEFIEKNKHLIAFFQVGSEHFHETDEEKAEREKRGDKAPTPHYQGYCRLKSGAKREGIRFWKSFIPGGHWANFGNARGSDRHSEVYTSKEGIFLSYGDAQNNLVCPYSEAIELIKNNQFREAHEQHGAIMAKNFNNINGFVKAWEAYEATRVEPRVAVLKEWQQQVLDMLESQGDREVLFIVDTVGANGKSFLAKVLASRGAFDSQGKSIMGALPPNPRPYAGSNRLRPAAALRAQLPLREGWRRLNL